MMPVTATPHKEERQSSRGRVLDELGAILESLRDPRGTHPAQTTPLFPAGDELELCAAVYAMPEDYRELGRTGVPLLWPWPASALQAHRPRRDQLLLAAALALAAVERLDRRSLGGRANLHLVTPDCR